MTGTEIAGGGRKTVAEILWQRRIIVGAIVAIGFLAALFFVATAKPKYSATSMILEVAEPAGDSSKNPSSPTKPVLAIDLPPIALSETVLGRVKADLHSQASIGTLRSQVKAGISTESNIMPVTFTAGNAGEAIAGANALTNEVTHYYRDIATARFDSLIGDLESQQSTQVARLTLLDRQLQNAAQTYPFIDTHDGAGSDGSSVYQRLIDLSAARDVAQATMAADASNASVIARQVGQTKPLALNNVVNQDATYKTVKGEYSSNVGKLTHLKAFASDAYPGMTELSDAVKRESADVAQARTKAAAVGPDADPTYVAALAEKTRADALLAGDRSRMATIATQIAEIRSSIAGTGAVASKVSTLRRERESEEAALGQLSSRLSQAINDRAEAASTGSVVVIDSAHFASRAVWTSGMFVGVAVFVLAIWLAISAALILESMDRRFDTEDSITSVYGAPVIGATN